MIYPVYTYAKNPRCNWWDVFRDGKLAFTKPTEAEALAWCEYRWKLFGNRPRELNPEPTSARLGEEK